MMAADSFPITSPAREPSRTLMGQGVLVDGLSGHTRHKLINSLLGADPCPSKQPSLLFPRAKKSPPVQWSAARTKSTFEAAV